MKSLKSRKYKLTLPDGWKNAFTVRDMEQYRNLRDCLYGCPNSGDRFDLSTEIRTLVGCTPLVDSLNLWVKVLNVVSCVYKNSNRDRGSDFFDIDTGYMDVLITVTLFDDLRDRFCIVEGYLSDLWSYGVETLITNSKVTYKIYEKRD